MLSNHRRTAGSSFAEVASAAPGSATTTSLSPPRPPWPPPSPWGRGCCRWRPMRNRTRHRASVARLCTCESAAATPGWRKNFCSLLGACTITICAGVESPPPGAERGAAWSAGGRLPAVCWPRAMGRTDRAATSAFAMNLDVAAGISRFVTVAGPPAAPLSPVRVLPPPRRRCCRAFEASAASVSAARSRSVRAMTILWCRRRRACRCRRAIRAGMELGSLVVADPSSSPSTLAPVLLKLSMRRRPPCCCCSACTRLSVTLPRRDRGLLPPPLMPLPPPVMLPPPALLPRRCRVDRCRRGAFVSTAGRAGDAASGASRGRDGDWGRSVDAEPTGCGGVLLSPGADAAYSTFFAFAPRTPAGDAGDDVGLVATFRAASACEMPHLLARVASSRACAKRASTGCWRAASMASCKAATAAAGDAGEPLLGLRPDTSRCAVGVSMR